MLTIRTDLSQKTYCYRVNIAKVEKNMEIITLTTKSQISKVVYKGTTQSCVQDYFLLSIMLYCGEKYLFKLHGCVQSLYLFHDRRSLLTVTQGDNEHKIVTLRIEKHINPGTNARLTGS